MTDPYSILGVPRNAGIDEIKRAFRARARHSHPDSNRENPNAETEFKTLLAAYENLCEAWKRTRHDRGKMDGRGSDGSGGGDPVHASAADPSHARGERPRPGGSAGRGDGPASGFKTKGTDVTYLLPVTFDEAAKGVTHHIDMVTGKKLAIKVPPGAFNGQILRLKGEGMPGLGDRAAGTALVELRVAPNPVLDRDGEDVRVDVPITLSEAVLGGRINVPTIDGSVKVSVPPGSNTGSILRLRGKGLPRSEGGSGDQYITLRVVLPSAPDHDLIQFVQRWRPKHPYSVRQP